MTDYWEPTLFVATWVVQLLGLLAIVILGRCSPENRHAGCNQLFLALLLVVGGMTALLAASGDATWMMSGTTLSIMTISVTVDRRRDAHEMAAF